CRENFLLQAARKNRLESRFPHLLQPSCFSEKRIASVSPPERPLSVEREGAGVVASDFTRSRRANRIAYVFEMRGRDENHELQENRFVSFEKTSERLEPQRFRNGFGNFERALIEI